MTDLACPECGATDNLVGIEVRGVYDGVLYWVCRDCGLAWERDWTGYGRRSLVCAEYVASHNAGRAAS